MTLQCAAYSAAQRFFSQRCLPRGLGYSGRDLVRRTRVLNRTRDAPAQDEMRGGLSPRSREVNGFTGLYGRQSQQRLSAVAARHRFFFPQEERRNGVETRSPEAGSCNRRFSYGSLKPFLFWQDKRETVSRAVPSGGKNEFADISRYTIL